jgi:hypothetical protein
MGLHTAKLFLEIEEAFDQSIPNATVATMRTPGDIFGYLADSSFKAMPIGPYLSQAVSNRLNRAIVAEFGEGRFGVKPKMVITRSIPQFLVGARRKSLLKRLDFRRPSPILAGANWFRHDYGTFGDLAQDILARNYGALAQEAGFWNPEEAWGCLRYIISQEIGVKIEKVTRKASL